MSLRKQAEILGVNAGHLSRMVNGKRPWKPELKARYEALVGNTFGNTRLGIPIYSAQNVARITEVEHDIAEVTSSTLVPPTIDL